MSSRVLRHVSILVPLAALSFVACTDASSEEDEPTLSLESSATVYGKPRVSVVGQIRPFTVDADLVSDVCVAGVQAGKIANCTPAMVTQIEATLRALAASANRPPPPNPFTTTFLASKEYRMYTTATMNVTCDPVTKTLKSDPTPVATIDHGWTPLPARVGFGSGVGNEYIEKTAGGAGEKSATFIIRNNSQVKELLGLVGTVGIPGSIVPFVWQELKWTVTCTTDAGRNAAKHEVAITASHFPSHDVYAGVGSALPKLTGAAQSDLPGFLYGTQNARAGTWSARYSSTELLPDEPEKNLGAVCFNSCACGKASANLACGDGKVCTKTGANEYACVARKDATGKPGSKCNASGSPGCGDGLFCDALYSSDPNADGKCICNPGQQPPCI